MTEEMLANAARFERVLHWTEFQKQTAHLFKSASSLRWFIRTHESSLIACGALLKLPRGNYIDAGPFRAAALDLMLSAGRDDAIVGAGHRLEDERSLVVRDTKRVAGAC